MIKFLSYLAITTIAITSHAAQKITITGNDTMQFDTFTAPDPGDYQFVCSFPGHFAMMRGIMVVK